MWSNSVNPQQIPLPSDGPTSSSAAQSTFYPASSEVKSDDLATAAVYWAHMQAYPMHYSPYTPQLPSQVIGLPPQWSYTAAPQMYIPTPELPQYAKFPSQTTASYQPEPRQGRGILPDPPRGQGGGVEPRGRLHDYPPRRSPPAQRRFSGFPNQVPTPPRRQTVGILPTPGSENVSKEVSMEPPPPGVDIPVTVAVPQSLPVSSKDSRTKPSKSVSATLVASLISVAPTNPNHLPPRYPNGILGPPSGRPVPFHRNDPYSPSANRPVRRN